MWTTALHCTVLAKILKFSWAAGNAVVPRYSFFSICGSEVEHCAAKPYLLISAEGAWATASSCGASEVQLHGDESSHQPPPLPSGE